MNLWEVIGRLILCILFSPVLLIPIAIMAAGGYALEWIGAGMQWLWEWLWEKIK